VKLFDSYTSADRGWAHWIGWQLKEAGHEAFLHEWEIGAGQNIPRWMEERIDEADHLIGVFSDKYCEGIFSRSERWAAYWDDPEGRFGFLIPIEVVKVTKWPRLVNPLSRLSLMELSESTAIDRLKTFLEPRRPPTEKPAYPGSIPAETSNTAFAQNSEPLGPTPPNFPLPSLLEAKSSETATSVSALAADTYFDIRCIDDHEPRPQIFGRDDETETIVNSLLERKIILIAGGPGMGKTAVATAAFYDPRIIAHFGRRRVFASLETATEPRAILGKLVETLGLAPTGDEVSLLRLVEANAAEKPLAAILDNAETVFDTDRVTSERLLNLVAQVQGLSLVVTIRGVPPHVPGGMQIDNLTQLDRDAATDAFLAVAGSSFKNDQDLPHILHALDGHALSIRLVAAQAIGSTSLAGIRESWDEVHAEILRISGEEESRLTSVRASLALSLNSKRMKSTPLARRLMALLAFLPSGLVQGEVHSLLGDRGIVTKAKANDAVVCLHQLRLVEQRPDSRLRMLTPLRECAKSDVELLKVDRSRLIDRYLKLAAKGRTLGSRDWEKFRDSVEAESDNLDAICELAVAKNFTHRMIEEALSGLSKYHVYSGRGSISSIHHAAARLHRQPSSRFAARCVRDLGEVASAHYDHETARARFEEALLLYQNVRAIAGEADCVTSLGAIEKMHSNHAAACMHFEKASKLYRSIGSSHGEANCVQHLGNIAEMQGNHAAALLRYETALVSYRLNGDGVGEANCIMSFGDIARATLDHQVARLRYDEALALYLRAGVIQGEADCAFRFGQLAQAGSDYESAGAHYERALILFRRIRSPMGEAEAIIRLGQAQNSITNVELGLTNIEAGFALYFKVCNSSDRALPGWKAMHRALTCRDKTEARRYCNLAKSSWTAIGRLDLVADWVDSA
jgi:tetratricopeptide (TPR) repeat protein